LAAFVALSDFLLDLLHKPDLQSSNNFACRRLGGVDLRLCRRLFLDWGWSHCLLLDDGFLFDSHCGFSPVCFLYLAALHVERWKVECQILTHHKQKSDSGKHRCRSFPTQIGPCQVSLRSNASLAVESFALASLATASFLAGAAFACGSAPGFLLLVAPASLGLEDVDPTSDFFLIAIFIYPLRASPAQS
jgi:hypothetical protein